MKRPFTLLAVATLAAGSLAQAQPIDADAPNEEANTEERVICKRVSVIGSLVKKRRVCMTAKQWTDVSTRSQEITSEMQKPSGAPRQ